MEYQTKRQRVTDYLKSVFQTLKENKRKGKQSFTNKTAIIANASIELGIKESEIEEVLITFQRAGLIEIKDDEVSV